LVIPKFYYAFFNPEKEAKNMATIEILNQINLEKDMSFVQEYLDFPQNIPVGNLAIVKGVLYHYSEINGVPTWYPLTKQKNIITRIQASASSEWVVNHQFKSTNFGVFVYDENNLLQIVQPVIIDENSFKVVFTKPKRGKLLAFFDSTADLPTTVYAISDDIATIKANVISVRDSLTAIEAAMSTDLDFKHVTSHHNGFSFVRGGSVWTTAGSHTSASASTTGRGLNATQSPLGLPGIQRVGIPEKSPIKKTGGGAHTYAFSLHQNGKLYVWGQNTKGQLGLGNTTAVGKPTVVLDDVVDAYTSSLGYNIDNNAFHVKRKDGRLYAAGYNEVATYGGSLATGNTTTTTVTTFSEVLLPAGETVKQFFDIGTSDSPRFCLTDSGKLFAWGYNGTGQLGDGTTVTMNPMLPKDVTSNWFDSSKTVSAIKVSGSHGARNGSSDTWGGVTVMLITYADGTTELKGAGAGIALGVGSTANVTTPVVIPQSDDVIDFAVMSHPGTVFMLKSNGDLYGFGKNASGELGLGNASQQLSPVLLTTNVKTLLMNGVKYYLNGMYGNSYIIKNDDHLYMSGQRYKGFCGDGFSSTTATMTTGFVKVLLPDNEKIVGVAFNGGNLYPEMSSYAFCESGHIYGWGYNEKNHISPYTTSNVCVPVLYKFAE
jgi:hypothetical protein